ncbi:hypothetical protein GQ457_05G019470 [Hibiscus cannabinus]
MHMPLCAYIFVDGDDSYGHDFGHDDADVAFRQRTQDNSDKKMDVNHVYWEKKFEQFTDMVAYMLVDKRQSFRPCGICTLTDHPTDYCPCLQVYGVGNFPGPPQMPHDPYGDTYNLEWQDHPNFSHAQDPWSYPTYQPYEPPNSTLEALLDQLVKSQTQTNSHMQEMEKQVSLLAQTNSRMQEMEKQLSLLAQTASRLESQIQEKLPSQTELDPEENMSVITLRSETVVEPPIQEQKEAEKSLNSDFQEEDGATTKEGSPTPEPEASPYVAQPPFPVRFIEGDKRAKEKENLDVSRKGEVHIPLLEVIREMPRYAHFLKELCANTIKFSGQAKVNLGEHISMVLTRRFPPKIKDQDMFAITRKIHKISLKEVLSWSKVQCL